MFFFLENLLGQKEPKMGPKQVFSSFVMKSAHETFLIFCMKLQWHEGLKLTQMIFLWKILYCDFGKKGTQNEFCEFYNNDPLKFFYFIAADKILVWVFFFWCRKTWNWVQNLVLNLLSNLIKTYPIKKIDFWKNFWKNLLCSWFLALR